MSNIMRAAVLGVVVLVAGLASLERVALRVTPTVAVAATNVRISVAVSREPGDSALRLTVDGPHLFRQSVTPLDHAQQVVTWRVPEGQSEVRAEVLGVDGRVRALARQAITIGESEL